jgi:hypothetical protein
MYKRDRALVALFPVILTPAPPLGFCDDFFRTLLFLPRRSMNQPAPAKTQTAKPQAAAKPVAPKPIPHVRSTTFFVVVCLVTLAAAAIGLLNSKSARMDFCGVVASQVYGIQTTVQNDVHLIPKGIKNLTLSTIDAGMGLMAKHCPPEALKPPEPEQAADPKEILKQLIGTMVQ